MPHPPHTNQLWVAQPIVFTHIIGCAAYRKKEKYSRHLFRAMQDLSLHSHWGATWYRVVGETISLNAYWFRPWPTENDNGKTQTSVNVPQHCRWVVEWKCQAFSQTLLKEYAAQPGAVTCWKKWVARRVANSIFLMKTKESRTFTLPKQYLQSREKHFRF